METVNRLTPVHLCTSTSYNIDPIGGDGQPSDPVHRTLVETVNRLTPSTLYAAAIARFANRNQGKLGATPRTGTWHLRNQTSQHLPSTRYTPPSPMSEE